VTNLTIREQDGNAVLSWTAPTTGINGAKLDPSKLTYTIVRNDETTAAKGISGTTFTDTEFASTTSQVFMYYGVKAVYGDCESEFVLSDYVILGPDNAVPFAESFANQSLDNTPWALSRVQGSSTGWNLTNAGVHPDVTAQDNDSGFASFNSFEMQNPTVVRLTSPKIDLFSAQHPVLSFWLHQSANDATETLEVEISYNDQKYQSLGVFPVKGAETGWKEFTIEIPRILCKEQAMLSFKATSGNGNNIHLDNIRVYEKGTTDYDIDLEAVSIELPQTIMVGDMADFTVTVYNNGSQTVSDYTVNLMCDDEIVMSTKGTEIGAGVTMQYIFQGGAEESDNHKTYTFKGSVTCATDQNPDNNVTPGATITVGEDGAVDTLTGNVIKVAGGRGTLTVCGAPGKRIIVSTLDGRSVASFVGSANNTISLERGIYIVAIEGKNVKVIVR
ncbi:MAG: choice-of-anchor J domain-containing protein, partial [Muribaculaceae bacterium]|nr:choice-of-anchor J domain-containing protein [Muribaculaceae bacterium]